MDWLVTAAESAKGSWKKKTRSPKRQRKRAALKRKKNCEEGGERGREVGGRSARGFKTPVE